MEIIILEDFKHLHDVYQDALGDHFQLHFFDNIKALKDKSSSMKPDFVIYDLQLKEGFLFDLIKPGMFGAPFMVVSSNDDEETIKLSFDKGAVDFLVKPFSNNELKIKVDRALSKFSASFEAKGRVCNNVAINLDRNIMSWKNFQIDLTPKESLIVNTLLERYPEAISRDLLSQVLWAGKAVGEKTINTHLYNIRTKLMSTDISLLSQGGKVSLIVDN